MLNTVMCAHMHHAHTNTHTCSLCPVSFLSKATYPWHILLSCHQFCRTNRSGELDSPNISSPARCSLKSKDIIPSAARKIWCYSSHVSPLCIKWHMADVSLWYLSLSPCIMFSTVPNFQQLDLINPGKTQRAQGSLNNWSDRACSLAASLPNIQGNHNMIENTAWSCLLVCLCTSCCSLWGSATKSIM